MKKLRYVLPALFLLFSFGFKSDRFTIKDNLEVVYPTKGTFKIRSSSYPEFKEVDFWVHDLLGREVYYANHAIGLSAPKEHIQLYADKEYIALMIKNANQIYLRKR